MDFFDMGPEGFAEGWLYVRRELLTAFRTKLFPVLLD
jgi:hypothetical protein